MRILQLQSDNFKRLRAVEIIPKGNLVQITGRNAQGKQHPVSEPVLTPSGLRPIGQIQVGDEVVGASGMAVKVTGVFPQKSREVWNVVMADGGQTRCGPEHLWTVSRWRNDKRVSETITTAEIIKLGVRMYRGVSRCRWAVPIVGPVLFSEQIEALPIQPWILGVILGDANIADTGYVQMTTDTEIIDRIGVDGYRRPHHSEGIETLGSGEWSFRLKDLGLAGKLSNEKFVPPMYFRASIADRAGLLAGLLDTDGYAPGTPTGACEFTSTSEALADAVVELARSLGGIAIKHAPVTKKYTYKGEKREGQPAWRVLVKTPTNPFTLTRKAQQWEAARERRPLRRYIDRIDRVEDEDCVCIAVDAEDGLYVANDYIVTHNTSVLDSIWAALGGAAHIQAEPIRKGTSKARIKLDLGELVVTRNFTEKGSSLVVEGADGSRFPSPQKMLDDLVGALTFDPLAFSRLKSRDQFDLLRTVAKLDLDLDHLDALNKRDFERRTELNREAKLLRAQIEGLPSDPMVGQQLVNVDALVSKMAETVDARNACEREQGRRNDVERRIQEKRAKIEQLRQEAQRLQAEVTPLKTEMETWQPLEWPEDTQAIREEISRAEAHNAKFRTAAATQQKRAEAENRAAYLESQTATLTETIEARKTAKQEAISKAQMPIPGLGFGEGVVLYNGVPFDQASSAERLKVSVALAMTANPKLRVLRIEDGSLLDDENMAVLEEMAQDNEFQIWIEVCDSTGKLGVVIHDGEVVADNQEQEALGVVA